MQWPYGQLTDQDVDDVTMQLGKTPRALYAVARRCRFGSPQVVVTNPVVHGPGRRSERRAGVAPDDLRVFPTTYWLTCPYLSSAVGRLEGAGWVARMRSFVSDPQVEQAMVAAHERAAAERLALVPAHLREQLQTQQPGQWSVLASSGVAGARVQTGVKCLHAHLADYLAGPVGAEHRHGQLIEANPPYKADAVTIFSFTGSRNPVGAWVMSLLLQSGVDISGWPGCKGCRTSTLQPESEPQCAHDDVAAMDVGTNSCRLLYTRHLNGHIEPVKATLQTTRLGEGLQASGKLQPQAIARTLDGLQSLLQVTDQLSSVDGQGCQKVAVATNAVRSSSNPEAILIPAWEQLGLAIRVVKGDEEAKLSFRGALAGLGKAKLQANTGVVSVLDIGGGSTELVVGEWNGIVGFSRSADIGAVRLTEMANAGMLAKEVQSQPFAWEQSGLAGVAALAHTALAILGTTYAGKQIDMVSHGTLVGVGGTCTSLAAIDAELSTYDPTVVQGYVITEGRLVELVEHLAAMPLEKRRKVVGLQPARADIIVAGTAILLAAMRLLSVQRLVISDTDILLGIIDDFIWGCANARSKV